MLGLSLGVRLWIVGAGFAPMDADVAAATLMARRILHGQQFLFFTGQRYMGSAEQYATAAAIAVLGENRWSRTIVGIGLGTAACGQVMLLTRRWAARALARPAAIAAGAAAAVGPFASVIWSVWPRGAHLAALVTTLAVLDLATRRRAGSGALLAVGVLTGFGIWLSLTTLVVTGPALWWTLARLPDRSSLRPAGWGTPRTAARAAALLAGLVLGVAPLLWAHLRGPGVDLLVAAGDVDQVGYPQRLLRVLTHPMAQALGSESTHVQSWPARPFVPFLPGVPGWWAVAVVHLAVLALAVRRRRALLDAALLRVGRRRGSDLALAVLLAAPWVLAASPMAARTDEPRYLVPLFPLLVIGTALAAARVRRQLLARLALVALVLACGATTVRWIRAEVVAQAARHAAAADYTSAEQGWTALAQATVDAGVAHVAGDYWSTQTLDLFGHGRFDVLERHTQEFAGTKPAVTAPGAWGFVDEDRRRAQWRQWFTERGHTFREVHARDVTLYLEFRPALTPAELDAALPPIGFPFDVPPVKPVGS